MLEAADFAQTATSGSLAAAAAPSTSIPILNSLPGAVASLYLDFNGHFEPSWGAYSNIATPAFDQDGDPTTFSDAELATIQTVWAHVAEDFAPFKINVTTVEPPSFANGVALRAAIGGDGSWFGGGGVAYVDSFTNSIANTVFVFSKNLGNGNARYVGEAVSHESGHAFGLDHQSMFSSTGSKTSEYNSGTGEKAPIMGNSYSAARGLWWAGQDAYNTFQDDMAVIARSTNGFGYRADDHGNTPGTATPLAISGTTAAGSGIITATGDVDYFSFDTGAGTISFAVAVPAGINNLDARLELRDAVGSLIASAAPSTSYGASLTASVAAGSYRIVVGSEGNYGDVGQYTIRGTIVAPTAATVAAPTNLAAVKSGSSVWLTWTDNASNETAYSVERSVGSIWSRVATLAAGATSFVDSGAASGSTYSYRVQAAAGSEVSAYSNVASVTFPPSAPGNLSASAVSSTQVNLIWSDVSGETRYTVERSVSGGPWTVIGTTGADAVSFQDASATGGTSYQYRVRASNGGGDSEYSNVADVATPTAPTTLSVPAAPSNLVAFLNAERQVQLSWKDNSDNESAFVIQRAAKGNRWATLGSVPADSTGVVDVSAVRKRTYSYRVFATNAAGNSPPSSVATIATPAYTLRPRSSSRPLAPVPTASGLSATLLTTTAAAGQQRPGKETAWSMALPLSASILTATDLSSSPVRAALDFDLPDPEVDWKSAVDAVFEALA